MAKIVHTAPNTIMDVKIYEVIIEHKLGENGSLTLDDSQKGLKLVKKHIKKYQGSRYLGFLTLNDKLTVYFFTRKA